MNSIYQINRGINKPIEFKGIKAQYIAYLAIGLVGLLLLFAILYLCGINLYICMAVVISGGTALFIWVTKYSHRYGRYGLMKRAAAAKTPEYLRIRSRKLFTSLQHKNQTVTT